jgi:polar amino acid transport system substrate-binding protein
VLTALFITALRWGGDLQGGAPYAAQDPHDPAHLVGFEVELADAIARELGTTSAFVQSDWSTLLAGLARGTYDIALNGLEDTPAHRAAAAAMSQPYYRFDLVLTQLAPGAAHGRVGVLEGSLAADRAAAMSGVTPALYQGVQEPYDDLRAGRLDGVLMDSVIAREYGKGFAATQTLRGGTYVIACAHAELCAQIDRALAAVKARGEWRAILERWHLWNDAQLAPNDPPTASVPASFTRRHLWLFVHAAGMTLVVSIAAMALAASWGLVLAVARGFAPSPIRAVAAVIVEVFRGTPVLLQLYVIYFGLAPYLPLPPVAAAVLTLGLNYGAYESEIYRGGLAAVSPRQWDAALALGLGRRQALRHVVLPQAMRVALPGMANDFVSLLKDSALVSAITVIELTKQLAITAVDVHSWLIPGAVCAALYLGMSWPAAQFARRLEHRLAHV